MYAMARKSGAGDTVQCMRKRVYGNGAHVKSSDLFYDKSDGKYYKNMNEIHYSGDSQIDFSEFSRYWTAALKDRSEHTLLLAQLPDKRTYMVSPRHSASASGQASTALQQLPARASETVHCAGMLVSEGTEEKSPPPIVRLYSEAEITHASTLAGKMTDAAHYNAFRTMGDMDLHDEGDGGVQAPLIKATEFDDREHVMARYSSNEQYKSASTIKKVPEAAGPEGVLKAKGAVRDAFTRGRLLAARHAHRYESAGHNICIDNKYLEELIDIVTGEVLAAGTPVLVAVNDERDAVTKEIKAEIEGILATVSELGNDVKAAVAQQFKKGYLAVCTGWVAQKKRLDDRESIPSLEVSYGGKTGDMTHPHMPHRAQRQYDIIQSTFFWMPGASSLDNAKAILGFFDAQYFKLKTEGIIRLVSFSNNEQRTEDDRNWKEKENQYGEAAEWVFRELISRPYYTDVKKIIYLKADTEGRPAGGMPYSEVLSVLGLNPMPGGEPLYRPLWTDTNKAVGAQGQENGNLVLQARKSRVFRP